MTTDSIVALARVVALARAAGYQGEDLRRLVQALQAMIEAAEVGDYQQARGALIPLPGSDAPEVIIRRLRDGG